MKSKILFVACALLIFGCKRDSDAVGDVEENAQQVGDVMASIDEAGGQSTGYTAHLENSIQKTFEKYAPNDMPSSSAIAGVLIPQAHAASCASGAAGFGACVVSGTITVTRTFSNCTVGGVTLSGDVTLAWGGGATTCALTADGSHVSRTPNFTLTGRRGSATLAVTKSGTNGQRLTKVSGTGASRVFSFSNDGIRRVFTLSGTPLFDQTTTTTSNLTITGADRSNRVISGGTLRVTNNIGGETCDFSPVAVTWDSSTCNCPRSGSWTASCSNGKTATLEITGCGTARYTEGSDINNVTFDRCVSTP